MTDRQPSAAELRQRREAAVTHGGHARARNDRLIEGRWRRLRKALNARGVRVREIGARDWLNLRLLVRHLVLIELVEPYVLELLEDPASGAMHDVIERYSGWLNAAAAIVARLPGDLAAVVEDDLAS